jgi:hypothetical protein
MPESRSTASQVDTGPTGLDQGAREAPLRRQPRAREVGRGALNFDLSDALATMSPSPVPHARADHQEDPMGKTGRKRRGRKKKAANHGKRPNA